jgi:dihydroneopterin aldolase
MDSVRVTDLRVQTRIGVTDEERASPQVVLVSFEVFRDLLDPSTSDDLKETIDYGSLVPDVAKLIERSETRLLERLAGDVASLIKRFPGVTGVTVEIAKESPPLDEEVGRVSVRIERRFE